LRRFLRHRLAVIGLFAFTPVVVLAIAAPLVTVHPPNLGDLQAVREGPSRDHWLGTDLIGRDVWSRVVYGARVSLTVGVLAVGLYVLIGTTLGAVAGFYGGFIDQVIMRLTESLMSLPSLLMVIVFVSVLGPSLQSVVIVIGLLGWPSACRLVRGQFLSLRDKEFITAAQVIGASPLRVMFRHMLVNTLGPLTVLATFGIASAILLEASLSFLGLGVRPPTASWGGMLNEAQSPTVLATMPWFWIPPGVAIAVTVLGVNFIGDGVRDALDPGSQRR
jgi:peptide/nickel transport system permease protein